MPPPAATGRRINMQIGTSRHVRSVIRLINCGWNNNVRHHKCPAYDAVAAGILARQCGVIRTAMECRRAMSTARDGVCSVLLPPVPPKRVRVAHAEESRERPPVSSPTAVATKRATSQFITGLRLPFGAVAHQAMVVYARICWAPAMRFAAWSEQVKAVQRRNRSPRAIWCSAVGMRSGRSFVINSHAAFTSGRQVLPAAS